MKSLTKQKERGQNQHRLLLLAGLLVAFALRLWHFGADSLWYDETVSAVLARKSIPALIAHTAGDIHPPGYYLLLHLWQRITAPTLEHGLEYLFAWPSLGFGMLAVALLYAVGHRLFSPPIALLALWLAAIHAFQIWYSQEVRMYTMGATLGLLCLWSLLQAVQPPTATSPESSRSNKRGWLLLYALFGAAGLYTLYYFLFLLAALAIIALHYLWTAERTRATRWQLTGWWLGSHGLLLLLWLPWLPIFWRQATNPPVPPWRVPWDSVPTLLRAMSESSSALLSGQSAPGATHPLWLLALLCLLCVTAIVYAKNTLHRSGLLIALGYPLLPTLLIYAVTGAGLPLYHVRYLSLYAPPLLLLLAAIGVLLWQQRRGASLLALFLLLLFTVGNGWSLQRFWHAPQFASDDHRAAVATLAHEWRPGEPILVNAGWAYTALQVYWPTELAGPKAATPPPLATATRLLDYAQSTGVSAAAQLFTAPTIVRTGSVDGAPTLGWNQPTSDFFATTQAETIVALEHLRQSASGIWHYRLYDTVSDPTGVIRSWLADNGAQTHDRAIPGRDFLRLQRYQLEHSVPATASPPVAASSTLHLLDARWYTPSPHAGETLYWQSSWINATGAPVPEDLRFSLRLFDERGELMAQQDAALLPAPATWSTRIPVTVTLALPVPAAVPPGAYSVRLLAYAGATGDPFTELYPTPDDAAMVTVGQLQLQPARQVPVTGAALAHFDYIALLQATLFAPGAAENQALALELIWQPRPNAYRDTYVARWQLLDAGGVVHGQWEEALGGWQYPSGQWPAAIPVLQKVRLPLTAPLAAGSYTLQMAVVRHADGRLIPATLGWWRAEPTLTLGVIEIQE